MTQRLKRWESPRKQGRNDKGKGGTARARQLRKREQMLRQKLKSSGTSKPGKLKHEEREITPSLFLWTQLFINSSFFPSYEVCSTGRRLLGKNLLTQNAPWEPPQRNFALSHPQQINLF